ncbi:MAG TPA: Holliday junction branch migration protein RuvA [Coriobacteriia bacterium]|nr:Holliday junction branch migration protein RuvA [Coriobacteriia bacterium]
MIAFLRGQVAGKGASFCLLDVNGVGYQLAMSTSSLVALPAIGDDVLVHTYMHVREDEISLFGFENEAEKDAFELLITVSGVGPKVALSTLSSLTPDALAAAIAAEDVATVSSVPGIGKKTAQRIILELADKLGAPSSGAHAGGKSGSGAALAEATDALLAMGFSAPEASAALKGADEKDAQGLLKHALKRLGGGS